MSIVKDFVETINNTALFFDNNIDEISIEKFRMILYQNQARLLAIRLNGEEFDVLYRKIKKMSSAGDRLRLKHVTCFNLNDERVYAIDVDNNCLLSYELV